MRGRPEGADGRAVKILHYSRSLTRSAGGLYHSVSGLAKASQAQGADVAVVGGADKHFAQDRAIWGDLRLHPHLLGRRGYGPSLKALADIRREKPDLIHVHGIWSASSVLGRLVALAGIPLVVSPRGMLEPFILARRPVLKAAHAWLFELPMFAKAHIHALTEAERSSVLAFTPSLRDRVFVVPNGVDDSPALPPDRRRSGALFLGRLHPKKQVLELIDAWRSAPALANERLTVAGWGARDYEAAVIERARGADNVEFAGALYGAAKEQALSGARYFVLPSLSEGLPMAVLEAVQHGCIPVITAECNLPALLEEGIAARIAADLSDLGPAIAGLAACTESELGRRSAAATHFAGRYRWPTIATQMIDQYGRIIANAGRA